MTEFTDVLFSIADGHGHITLNRPEALNALTLPMIDAIAAQLSAWERRVDIKAIVITGGGGKAFCAGGDVKALHAAKARGDLQHLEDFYRREYTLNYRLATYPKPIIAVMDGITMGGGAGIALNCSHPIVTHKTLFAMPECRIGFFPDVGAALFLNKCSRAVAMALGLTGLSLRGPGVIKVGLADRFIGSGRVNEIRLDNLDALALPVETAGIEQILPQIETVFGLAGVDEIVTALAARRDSWGTETLKLMADHSPTSLKVTFAHLTRSRGQSLSSILAADFRIAQHFVAGSDFFEGVRAHLIDRDGAPKWQPDTLAAVTDDRVEAFFGQAPGIRDWSPPN
ncbi:3-hydroxyisobutyryl-CoA hydrolase [Dongia mobilis]|uniref:3-hydroxyisobutyryl-CoA hydrolase n=1 Tax=Dongia mobilis TaxID=578943 RepID=A0A4V3DEE7_9PROT|nr:enoyl-CoA hydratase/isomerase family protein [Dongia mobilis]TDQ80972.1 3-hydroxyisobutyryl-CoA hydrolase [Dongia mobilis]